MAVNNGQNQITLPPIVRAGDSITAKWANSMRDAIQKLRDRKPKEDVKTKVARTSAPFMPFIKKVGEQWQISASRGIVIEKVSTAAEDVDALLYWTPSNALTDGLPTWFNISSGQSLFVVVTEENAGTVRVIANVSFSVMASSTISTAYIPDTQEGVYYYEIAKFTIVDAKPVIERWAAGSHIFHEVQDAGWWGTCSFLFTPAGGGGSTTNLIQTFKAGRLVSVSLDGVDQEGTVEVLGDAEWEINV